VTDQRRNEELDQVIRAVLPGVNYAAERAALDELARRLERAEAVIEDLARWLAEAEAEVERLQRRLDDALDSEKWAKRERDELARVAREALGEKP